MHFNVQITFNLVRRHKHHSYKILNSGISGLKPVAWEQRKVAWMTRGISGAITDSFGCNYLRDLVKKGGTHLILTKAMKMPGRSGGKLGHYWKNAVGICNRKQTSSRRGQGSLEKSF